LIIGHITSKSSASGHIRLRASPKHAIVYSTRSVCVDSGNPEFVENTGYKILTYVFSVCSRNRHRVTEGTILLGICIESGHLDSVR